MLTDKKEIKSDLFDIIMGAVCFFSVFSIIYSVQMSVFFSGIALAAVYTVFFAVGTLYIIGGEKHFPVSAIFPGLVCLLTVAGISLHDSSGTAYALDLLLLFSVYYCAELSSANRYPKASYLYIIELSRLAFIEPMLNLLLPGTAFIRRIKSKTSSPKLLGVAMGALLALPVFIVAFALLQSGDAAFEGVTYEITKAIGKLFQRLDENGELIYILANTFVFGSFVYSTVFGYKYKTALMRKKELEIKVQKSTVISPNVICGFLGSISLLYVAYIVSQTSYLFSAMGGRLPATDITLAHYARRGFFEMSAVAAINLCLIAVGVIFCKRKGRKINTAVKSISIFICAFTMMLIITAVSKMGLYIAEFGLTHKRLLVFLADAVLFVCFGCIIVRLFSEKFPYMKIILAAVCTLAVSMTLVNTDYIIGKTNVKLFLSGYHEEIDLDELYYNIDEYTAMLCFDELMKKGDGLHFSKEKVKTYMGRIYENNKDREGIYTFDRLRLHKYITKNEATLKNYLENHNWHYEYSEYYGEIDEVETVYIFSQSQKDIYSVDVMSGDEITGVVSANGEYLEPYGIFSSKIAGEAGSADFDVKVHTGESVFVFTVIGKREAQQESNHGAIYRNGGNIFCIRDTDEGALSIEELPDVYAFSAEDAEAYIQRYKYSE